jgi:hypothetical protein
MSMYIWFLFTVFAFYLVIRVGSGLLAMLFEKDSFNQQGIQDE